MERITGTGYRIYFGRDGEALIGLPGEGTKRRQSADIEAGQNLWESVPRPQARGDLAECHSRETSEKRCWPAPRRDPEFREGLLSEGIGALLEGQVEVGKALLRDYINAAIGFDELGRLTDKSPKSLMRMFGPNGNPQARNLFEVINQIQRHEGVRLQVRTVR